MEFTTLDETFMPLELYDEFESAIWTERYITAGDFQLVLPATPERIAALKDGTFIMMTGSDEIMQIETQSIENSGLTITGKSIESFFNQRWIKTSSDPAVRTWEIRDKPGAILTTMVQDMVIASAYLDSGTIGIGGVLNKIPNLVIGDIDTSGDTVTASISFGPMYDEMLKIADKYKIGMSLKLNWADPFGYELGFSTFKGVDRTTGQLEYDLVQFSPAYDTMINIKEVHSIAGYKNVVYAFPPSAHPGPPVVLGAPGFDLATVGFDRRVLVIACDDISDDQITGGVTLASLMTQKAKDALANNNFTKVLDGEVVPQADLIYGGQYNLGDLVELVGLSGIPQKARITEYIRSQDATGERAYPTVSVVD